MNDLSNQKKVLVVGANGFIGSKLCETLELRGLNVFKACRRLEDLGSANLIRINNFDGRTPWLELMPEVDVVIATISRVAKNGFDEVTLSDYNKVNLEGTLKLAQTSIKKGVKRFIYLSSVKVNGEFTNEGGCFRSCDPPGPIEAYGQSKLQTETALRALVSGTEMELVIVRMPLVYGPGVKGNFRQLLHWVHKGYPLPLKWMKAKRSMVALDNVVSLIDACVTHPGASGQVVVFSDEERLSTSELLVRMAGMMGVKSRLFPFPPVILKCLTRILGKPGIGNRLCRPLVVDTVEVACLLGWTPPVSADAALKETIDWFLAREYEEAMVGDDQAQQHLAQKNNT